MRCEIPCGLWLPRTRKPSLLVFLLHGKSRHSERIDAASFDRVWNAKLALGSLAEEFGLAIAAPLCGNGWHLDSPLKPEGRVASMLSTEFAPFAEALLKKETCVSFSRATKLLLGFSMGGYGALAWLCREPERFAGALLKAPSDPIIRSPGGELRDVARELFGSEAPRELLLESYSLSLMERLRGFKPALALSCGSADSLLPHCRALRAKAEELALPLFYEELPGEHKLSAEDFRLLFKAAASLLNDGGKG